MDILYIVIGCFSLLGALDLITGNHLGIGREFERGLMLLGTMTMTMIGMIVLAPLFAELLREPLLAVARVLPFEPSLIAGSLLANDMGGGPLAMELATSERVGLFNGLVVSSMMGATISFTLPFALGATEKRQHKSVLLGMLCGIVAIPLGCLVSGLMMQLSLYELAVNLIPLLLFAGLLAFGLLRAPMRCVRIFHIFGIGVKALVVAGLALAIFTFLTDFSLLPHMAPLEEGITVVFNAAAVMSGMFPIVALLGRLLNRPLRALGAKIGINATSALGFVATLATNVTTFGMMKDMDERGCILNSAFAVSAAFTFAGHLAYTLAFMPPLGGSCLAAVVVGKLTAGAGALLIAYFLLCRKTKDAPEEITE